jgi:hypothetical protein
MLGASQEYRTAEANVKYDALQLFLMVSISAAGMLLESLKADYCFLVALLKVLEVLRSYRM